MKRAAFVSTLLAILTNPAHEDAELSCEISVTGVDEPEQFRGTQERHSLPEHVRSSPAGSVSRD